MVPLVLTVAVNVANLQIFYVEPRLLLPHIYLKRLGPVSHVLRLIFILQHITCMGQTLGLSNVKINSAMAEMIYVSKTLMPFWLLLDNH